MKGYPPLLVIFSLLAIPVSAETQTAATAIREIDRAYDRAFVEPNAPANLTHFFTNDATVIPSNAAALNGTKDINAFWDAIFSKLHIVGHVLQVVDVVPEGENAAVATGHYSTTLKAEDGQDKTVGGDYLQVWEKRAEGWKIRFLSWNTLPDRNKPLQQ
jgi:ketosteroid isomerase-like protein